MVRPVIDVEYAGLYLSIGLSEYGYYVEEERREDNRYYLKALKTPVKVEVILASEGETLAAVVSMDYPSAIQVDVGEKPVEVEELEYTYSETLNIPPYRVPVAIDVYVHEKADSYVTLGVKLTADLRGVETPKDVLHILEILYHFLLVQADREQDAIDARHGR